MPSFPSFSLANAAAALTAGKPVPELIKNNGPDTADGKDFEDIGESPSAVWYHPATMDGRRWDQAYPYQLLVLDRTDDGGYRQRGDWKYTLPIPPEALTITTPFAITTTVTQGGIVEEHNAAPLRDIEIQGTTGVLPARPAGGQAPRPGLGGAIFAGTIAAAGRVAQAAQDVVVDLQGGQRPPSNLIPDDQLTDDGLLKQTGHWQIRSMLWFLEAYATFKRSANGRNCVLALACWKDEHVYLVTPKHFSIRKAADSPMETGRYNLSLTGFARVKIDGPSPAPLNQNVPNPASPDAIAATLNTLQDVRRVLQATQATIRAVLTDVDRTVFEPIRELILLSKDAMGVPIALVDLPAAIVRDAADTVVAAVAAGQNIVRFPNDLNGEKLKTSKSIQDDIARIKASASAIQDRTTVSSGTNASSTPTAASRAPAPVTDMFSNPAAHQDLLGAIRPDVLSLPPNVRQRIKDEVKRVRALTRTDISDRRTLIAGAATTFEDRVGAGDATFAATFGQQTPAAAAALSTSAFQAAAALSDAVTAADGLRARAPAVADAAVVSTLQTFADLAATAGIPFQIPRSKFPVPFPYGTTLEALAARYLGDPNRVGELIALNNLRAPYVDEVGVDYPFQAAAAGRYVTLAADADLSVGQTVWIESNTLPRVKRHVVTIERPAGQTIVELDGDDLDAYVPASGARLHAYAPGTINSQQLIFIPSAAAPNGGFRVPGASPGLDFDPLLSVGGVDLQLTTDGLNDLVVTPDGDGRWSLGLTNLTQIFRILMGLRRGDLLQHLDLGLPIRPGDSFADLSAADAVSAVRHTLAADSAFTMVRGISFNATAPAATLNVDIEVGATNVVVPLSVQLG